jgi:hypothetical protein
LSYTPKEFITLPVREYYEFVQNEMIATGRDMEYSHVSAYYHYKRIHGFDQPMHFPDNREIEKLIQKAVDKYRLEND